MSYDALTFGRLRGFGATDGLLLSVSLVSSVIYLVTKPWQPYPGSIVFKALSIAPLALLAVRLLRETATRLHGLERLRDRDNIILGAALGFSCLGDIFLDLSGSQYFTKGLLSFLVAHFIYILLFVRNWQRPLRPTGSQLLLTALVLVYSLLLANWLAPYLGQMARPVMVYMCAITVMTIATILAGFSRPWVWLGALLFMLSDSMIAVNRYKQPVPLRDYLVWGTYYLGQYGIAIGFLREKLGDETGKHETIR